MSQVQALSLDSIIKRVKLKYNNMFMNLGSQFNYI